MSGEHQTDSWKTWASLEVGQQREGVGVGRYSTPSFICLVDWNFAWDFL